ncbi:hypothetical protein ACIA03_02720 [Nocardioides sp. NPDC051685]|uniref:hypothetical protein n=1 Tax=Nocardioides sp. NPDC051685 TaxID=3364334 RepID=UPI003792336D
MDAFKKSAIWTGVVLTALCGIVLLGGGKIVSGTLLIATTFLMVSPLWRHKTPRWARVGLLCLVFGLVIWNISTTDLPGDSDMSTGMVTACPPPDVDIFARTGVRFVDQAAHILSAFLDQAQLS